MNVSSEYREWQNRALKLLKPLESLAEEGKASLPIRAQASDHGLNADRLESVARPFLLLAHWRESLKHHADAEDDRFALALGKWFAEAIIAGTDPQSKEFWGYSTNFHQHSVEMGLLVIGLEISRDWFWDTLSNEERDQIAYWLESDIGNGHHWNNHMFFGIFVMEFLLRENKGHSAYRNVIDRWFGELEGMYRGEGWFMDGMNQAFDYYNAYAWHYYGQWWIRLYGDRNEERCRRWRNFSRAFLSHYSRFFAKSGEHPAFGRSITYRFNASAPFGMAQLVEGNPLDPGLCRQICERNLDFFLSKPVFQEQGCLSLGWYDEFESLVESYSCGGSTYWAAKAFAPLLLKPDDAFWDSPKAELPAAEGDAACAFESPGLVVRSVEGEVEILNAGTQIASCNTRFGSYKWGKLSYRTGVGFLISNDPNRYPLDSGLTAENPQTGTIYGRHYTTPVAVESDKIGCLYSLGHKQEVFQISVETRVWWNRGWQLIVHRYASKQSSVLRHGSYALSNGEPNLFRSMNDERYARIESNGQGVALQSICGYDIVKKYSRLDESEPRSHIQAPFHCMYAFERTVGKEEGYLACLSWSGKNEEEGAPWSVCYLEGGEWALEHDEFGEWKISDGFLPCVSEITLGT